MCQVKGRILKGWKMANQDEWYCGNDFFVLLLMMKGHAIIVWLLCI